jgi:hypothetical protein
MLNSSSVRIDVNDLLEELREENNTLLKQLLFAQKCQKLLQKYRNNLNNICINCKCDQNFENKLILNNLEIEYKCISEEYSQEFNNNLKVINKNFEEKSINNNTNKRTLNEMTINQKFNKKHNISNDESINKKLKKSKIKSEIIVELKDNQRLKKGLNGSQSDQNCNKNEDFIEKSLNKSPFEEGIDSNTHYTHKTSSIKKNNNF